jgi:DNA-binding ferritin-like protein
MEPTELSSQLRQIADFIDSEEKPDKTTVASKIKTTIAALGPESISPLSSVVAGLRAARFLTHTYHWVTTGPQFYGDHLLLQRIYEGTEFDNVAEKTVAYEGSVDPIQQVQAVSNLIAKYGSQSDDPESLLASALDIEKAVIEIIAQAKNQLEQSGQLTDGIDNMLQGIADGHETFVYLLQQRLK